jgi:hypothetical protein
MRSRDVFWTGLLLFVTSRAMCAGVDLDPEQRNNLGIQTERPRVTSVARTWAAAAQVLDVAPLVTLLTELHSAETAANASAAELARTEQLHRNDTNVSLKSVEAARSQAATDAGRVAAARSQLFAAWGSGIASLSKQAREALLDQLLAARVALVRAEPTTAISDTTRIGRAQLQSLDESRTWNADLLGSLPQTNAPSVAGAFLFRVPANLPAGQILLARLNDSGAPARGLSVPVSAIVHWRGAEWIYEETQPNHFERREIQSGTSVAGRILIAGEPNESHAVVTIGSRALLAVEQGAPAED